MLEAVLGVPTSETVGGEVVALAGARVGQKLYMPSALLAKQLPAGLGAMQLVPRLMDLEADDDAERLEMYIATIRRTARVFEVTNCKQETWYFLIKTAAMGSSYRDRRAPRLHYLVAPDSRQP